jgi:GNAT superfamily N-acetyltransferase
MLRQLARRFVPRKVRAQAGWLWSAVSHRVLDRLDGVVSERSIEISPGQPETSVPLPGELLHIAPRGRNEAYLGGLTRPVGDLSLRRARRYLRNGYGGVALVREGRVVGDVWYVTLADAQLPYTHPDVRAMRISLDATTAYLFDMYVEPEHRGMAVSTALFRAAFAQLRAQGIVKAMGYYDPTNVPALWMHRVLGYKEVRRVKVIRVFRRAVSYSSAAA